MRAAFVRGMLVLSAVAACSRPTPPAAAPSCAVASVPIDSSARAQLVEARDAVWRAWFAGDSAALVRLLPEQMVGMGQSRADIIAEAQGFARGGGRLVKLEFTCDEFFLSGNVAVVYSSYSHETNEGGKPSVTTGRAIELFERRDGRWVNPSWHLDENRN